MQDIQYVTTLGAIAPDQLRGFFVGWRKPLTPEEHLCLLRGSAHVVLAVGGRGDVVGFINAVSDGCYAAYIPLLEVLPEYQGRGIGSELVRRMMDLLGPYRMIDLVCDEDMARFYRRLGWYPGRAMMIRR